MTREVSRSCMCSRLCVTPSSPKLSLRTNPWNDRNMPAIPSRQDRLTAIHRVYGTSVQCMQLPVESRTEPPLVESQVQLRFHTTSEFQSLRSCACRYGCRLR